MHICLFFVISMHCSYLFISFHDLEKKHKNLCVRQLKISWIFSLSLWIATLRSSFGEARTSLYARSIIIFNMFCVYLYSRPLKGMIGFACTDRRKVGFFRFFVISATATSRSKKMTSKLGSSIEILHFDQWASQLNSSMSHIVVEKW